MNRKRREVLGGIFADAAKFTLTAGIIASFFAGKFEIFIAIWGGLTFAVLAVVAYFITPQDKEIE